MDKLLTKNDLYPIRYESMSALGHGNARGTMLFENVWGLDFAQDDPRPWEVPFEETQYYCTILKPYEDKMLAATSQHGIARLEYNYRTSKIGPEKVVELANEIAQLAPSTDFTVKETFAANVNNRQGYYVTQIGATPVHIGNGQILEVDVLRAMMRAGALRRPFDFRSPETADPTKRDPKWLMRFDDEGHHCNQ